MTLDYKILWIDDRDDFFKNHEEYIKDHIEDKGFEANIVKHKSLAEYLEKDTNPEYQKKYDLFLIDLNLDNGNKGDNIINQIRSNNVLTDIVFYSTNLQDVRKSISENNIEGIFTTSRNKDDFEQKVTDLIDVTIKKVQDVNNLRGLIMAEVAELDRQKERILLKYALKTNDRTMETYILDKLQKSYEDNQRKSARYKEKSLQEIIDNLYVDSDKKARAIAKVDSSFQESVYRSTVLKKRNLLAHVEAIEEDGILMVGSIPFTEESCITIRQEIRKYKDELDRIEQQL